MSEKLAACGGTPLVAPEDIAMGFPFITQDDKDAVMSVLDACQEGVPIWGIAPPNIAGAEKEWAQYLLLHNFPKITGKSMIVR